MCPEPTDPRAAFPPRKAALPRTGLEIAIGNPL
jgi:hypothetical protein